MRPIAAEGQSLADLDQPSAVPSPATHAPIVRVHPVLGYHGGVVLALFQTCNGVCDASGMFALLFARYG